MGSGNHECLDVKIEKGAQHFCRGRRKVRETLGKRTAMDSDRSTRNVAALQMQKTRGSVRLTGREAVQTREVLRGADSGSRGVLGGKKTLNSVSLGEKRRDAPRKMSSRGDTCQHTCKREKGRHRKSHRSLQRRTEVESHSGPAPGVAEGSSDHPISESAKVKANKNGGFKYI